jgi:hypothetical protein
MALALSGCAGAGAQPAPPAVSAAAPVPEAPARAERLAEALVAADRAERAADAAALAQAAQRLERIAPAAQTEDDAAAMRRWLAGLPPGSAPMRGRALGPAYRSVALEPGRATQLAQTFLGGRAARIVVKVMQGKAPHLMVRDQSAREVCRADRDPVTCRWMPLYTQRHQIEIVNDGREMSRFYIVFD